MLAFLAPFRPACFGAEALAGVPDLVVNREIDIQQGRAGMRDITPGAASSGSF